MFRLAQNDTAFMISRFERRRLSLGVAGVLYVNALWKQAFATALAAAGKSGAAALCSHPGAKTVLAFTRSFRWLISALHKQKRETG